MEAALLSSPLGVRVPVPHRLRTTAAPSPRIAADRRIVFTQAKKVSPGSIDLKDFVLPFSDRADANAIALSLRGAGCLLPPLFVLVSVIGIVCVCLLVRLDVDLDASEVLDWESGKPLDDIAATQGIRIRRYPPALGNAPRNILEEIIWHKNAEVSLLQKQMPLDLLKRTIDNAPPVRDFIGALKNSYSRTGMPALIAEVKKASPSKGVLRKDFEPVEIARAYEEGGAACLSVLTDEKFFQGSFENLEAIRSNGIMCPLLCKEFIIDPWQIYYARSKGADAVLLIAAVLLNVDIKYYAKICRMLGMTALVEVHDEREMERVLDICGIQLIGINNRNLETFEVDLSNTKRLLEGENGEIILERDIMVVGESGLFVPEDVAYVQKAGVQAILVGESIVKQRDLKKGIAGLFGKDISA